MSKYKSSPIRVLLPGSDVEINSFIHNLTKIPNVNKLDLRVYLIPSNNKVNTLGDFLAAHDNLYESLIYRPFLDNPYYKILPNEIFEGEGFQEFIQHNMAEPGSGDFFMKENQNSMLDALDHNLQTYFREAVETYEVKVYELSLICENQVNTFYFCCRVELGCESAYYDAAWNSKNMSAFDEEILLYSPVVDISNKDRVLQIQEELMNSYYDGSTPTFQATVKVNKMDPLQKEYNSSDETAYNRNITM